MFCVECGKEGPIFRDGSCITCYLKNKQFTKGPAYLDIYVCARCNGYKFKNTWLIEPFDAVLHRYIKETFTVSPELRNVRTTTAYKEKDKTIQCTVTFTGQIDDQEIVEEHPLTVRLRRETCEVCSRQAGGYYEATLQIRSDKRKLTDDELMMFRELVGRFVDSTFAKGNTALFITDVVEEKGGIDFYLSEKGSAFNLAKKLYEQFGGELKQSNKNVGMKDSRQVYRMTYLVRLPAYQKGDILSYQNKHYMVSSLHGPTVYGVDLVTWTKRVFNSKDLLKAHVLEAKDCVREMILVSQTVDEVQVMNPTTYEMIHIRKPEKTKFSGEKISIVVIEDRFFLLPPKP